MPTNTATVEEIDSVQGMFSDDQLDFLGCILRIYNILEKKGLPEDEFDEIFGNLYEMFARFDLQYYGGNMMADHLERMMRPAAFEALCENIANDAGNMVNEDLVMTGCSVDDCDDDEDAECADGDYEDDGSDDDAPRGHLA